MTPGHDSVLTLAAICFATTSFALWARALAPGDDLPRGPHAAGPRSAPSGSGSVRSALADRRTPAALRALSIAAAALSSFAFAAALVAALGWKHGLVASLVLAMTTASLLVLVLSPRPQLSSPVALASASLGIVLGAVAFVGGGS